MNSLSRRDCAIALAGFILSIVLASQVMTGWVSGLIPNLHYPYVYAGDALSHYAMVQRAIEGWVWDSPRLGFPFGSPWYDYPGSDSGNLFVLKLLGMALGGYAAASNAYFLLGFGVTFVIGYAVLRSLGLRTAPAAAAALLFAFVPYHFARLLMGHMFYSWYFAIPVFFYCAAWLMGLVAGPLAVARLAALSLALAVTACFGVYFALFGTFTIALGGIAATVKQRQMRPLWFALALCASLAIGVGLNVAPSKIYTGVHGPNPEVAQRSPIESEAYALKPMHLVMPPPDHRVEGFAKFGRDYATTFPLTNTVSYVGLVGLLGLLVMAVATVNALVGRMQDGRIGLATLLSLATVLMATVGGLNVLFALWVSPLIRGWDRFGIFVDFYALVALAVFVDRRSWGRAALAALVAVVAFGIFDQTASAEWHVAVSGQQRFEQDRALGERMESALPKGAAVYQMPYVGFPEVPPLHNLQAYEPFAGFLNSTSLRWSYGGIRGREADRFFRELANKPVPEQMAAVAKLGYSAVYVMHAGYPDGGKAVVAELAGLYGPPILTRADGMVSVFNMRPAQPKP